jgi:adenine phosphoribosyltransferase
MSIILNGNSDFNIKAVTKTFPTLCVKNIKSGITKSPFGIDIIRNLCYSKLDQIYNFPAVSVESGIYNKNLEVSCCVIRTRVGTFEEWTIPYLNDSLLKCELIVQALTKIKTKWISRTFKPFIGANLENYKNIPFIDIQVPLIYQSRNVSNAIRNLTKDLLFDAVILVGSRGYLFSGSFMEKNIPVVRCDKSGKIPGECYKEKYDTEYSYNNVNSLPIHSLNKGWNVIVVDDIASTGGTFKSVKNLTDQAECKVVAYCSLYAVEIDGRLLINHQDLLPKYRFVHTLEEVKNNKNNHKLNKFDLPHKKFKFIIPPSMIFNALNINNDDIININWDQLCFNSSTINGKSLRIFANTTHKEEFLNVLQIISIIDRYNPKDIALVLPFIDYSSKKNTDFILDIITKIVGNTKLITFDFNSKNTVFNNIENYSLINILYKKFIILHPNVTVVFPNQELRKRFSHLLGTKSITFNRGEEIIFANNIIPYQESDKSGEYVIINDIVRSGFIMYEVANYIKIKGGRVHALFVHAPINTKAGNNLNIFNSIYTTDSCSQAPPNWVKLHVCDLF